MGEPRRLDDMDVNIHQAEGTLAYASVFAERVGGKTGRALMRLRATHYLLHGDERPGAMETYRTVMSLIDAGGERARFEAWMRSRHASACRWPTREDHELRERMRPKIVAKLEQIEEQERERRRAAGR